MYLVTLALMLLCFVKCCYRRKEKNNITVDDIELGTTEALLEMCSICQESPRIDEIGTKLACGHVFHYLCIEEWALKENTCPMCRAVIINII
jgi:hypothetical protein